MKPCHALLAVFLIAALTTSVWGATPCALSDAFLVNDDTTDKDQTGPAVTVNPSGQFLVVWTDKRLGVSQMYVYGQFYNRTNIPLDANFMLSDSSLRNELPVRGPFFDPAVAGSAGSFVAVWSEGFDFPVCVVGQRFDSLGARRDSNFLVIEPALQALYPSLAMDGAGCFFTVWDQGNVMGHLFDSTAKARGGPIVVLEDCFFPSAAFDGEEHYVVSSCDWSSVWLRRCHRLSGTLEPPVKVAEQGPTYSSVSGNGHGGFLVVWESTQDDSLADIFCRRYDANALPIGQAFRVNDDTGSARQRVPSIAVHPRTGEPATNSGEPFVVFWTDYRNPETAPDVMTQVFDANGNPVGPNTIVNDPDAFVGNEQHTHRRSVACNDDKVVFVWQDNRRHKGYDIYARVMEWSSGNPVEENKPRRPGPMTVHVYPNPADGAFYVELKGCAPASCELCVYDATGRLVRVLRAEDQIGFGRFTVRTEGFSSGVFFVQVKSPGGNRTGKVVLQKN